MPTFRNRTPALEMLCGMSEQNTLINVYGEPGIGKTALLLQTKQILRETRPEPLIMFVDLRRVASRPLLEQGDTLLREIIQEAQETLEGIWSDLDGVAGQIITDLSEIAARRKVILMFDNTETVQEDRAFWGWLEEHITSPLLIEGQVNQVYAGRIPAPWRRVEIRRALRFVPLKPLALDSDARQLIEEELLQSNAALSRLGQLDLIESFVLEFSFGHPLLSSAIAQFVATRWAEEPGDTLSTAVCDEIIIPFINENFFKDIDPLWKQILWWISVLDWFDATILQRYLLRLEPSLVQNKPEIYFIQGISRLRTTSTVIWTAGRGDRLYGVIGDIVRHCLQVRYPERYRSANLAAHETFQELARDLPPNDEDIEAFRSVADLYRERIS